MHRFPPPRTEAELLQRAWSLAGLTLDELANELQIRTPENLLHHKGWIGETLERVLGATAGSKPEPDFQSIGVELKTIPVSRNGRPKESTHVCTMPLTNHTGLTWETSLVRQKLSRVLWIPILIGKEISLSDRLIGSPLLWSPHENEEAVLKSDWEELMELVNLGEHDQINAHLGEALQIRPKAANSQALTDGIGKQGDPVQTLPRGFYLRTSFTASIMQQYYHIVP